MDDGRVLALGSGRQTALLAVLLLHRNEVVSTDRLVEELWAMNPPATAAKSVRNAISLVRKEIGGRLVTRAPGYLLQVEEGELDADRVEALRARAREQEPEQAAELLRAALRLFRGRPLSEVAYEQFAQAEIRRLDELRLGCLEDRIDAELALGRHAELVGELETLVSEHPLRERLRGQLMLALYRCGRQADALDAYQQARRALTDDLGIDPSRQLQALERRILNQDETLEPPPSLRRNQPARPVRRGGMLAVVGAILVLGGAAAAAILEPNRGGRTGLSGVAANSVGLIDPNTDRIVAQIPVGAGPTRISAGHNAVWVVNEADATLSRIDYRTHAVRTIAAPDTPTAVAAAAESVWLLSGRQESGASDPFAGAAEVSKIDPPSVYVLGTTRIGALAGNTFNDAIAASEQEVWVSDPGTLTRINPTSAKVAARYQVGSQNTPYEGIVIAYGSLWVLDQSGLLRVNPRDATILAQIQTGEVPVAVAAGAGAIWVVSRPGYISRSGAPTQIGRATLSRVDPGSNTLTAAVPLAGNPTDVAVGEGSVWVADGSTQSIIKANPNTDRLIDTIPLGSHPQAITIGDGRVWVSAQ